MLWASGNGKTNSHVIVIPVVHLSPDVAASRTAFLFPTTQDCVSTFCGRQNHGPWMVIKFKDFNMGRLFLGSLGGPNLILRPYKETAFPSCREPELSQEKRSTYSR